MRSEEWWCKRLRFAPAFGRLLWAAAPRYGGAFGVRLAEWKKHSSITIPEHKKPTPNMSFRATAQRFARNLF